MTRATADWRALRDAIAGEVLLPGAAAYDTARRPGVARFAGVRPQAVVRCATPADVAETIAFARDAGLPAAPRSGGHCFAGSSTTEGVVVDVTPMASVSVSDGIATVGAGARLGRLYDALLEHGRTIAAGCGPDVGIAGLALGGGLGILGRTHGLTADQLVGAEVVLADGRIVDCDERRDEDLFWALRGAGGGLVGIVTSLRLRTAPPPAATAIHLVWPGDRAAALIDAWQAWGPGGPDELAASLLAQAGADPARPPRAHVFGALLEGGPDEAAALLDDLVAQAGAGPAAASALAPGSHRETKRRLVEHGPDEAQPDDGHLYSRSEFFRRPLPADAVRALTGHLAADRVPGQFRELDFSPWGGAYNRVPEDATAFAHRGERFLLKHAVIVAPDATEEERAAARRWLAGSWEITRPWGSGRVYPNFPDPELEDAPRAYHAGNLERLRRVVARFDPDGFFGRGATSVRS